MGEGECARMNLASNVSDDFEPPPEESATDAVDPLVLAARIFRVANGKSDDDLDDVISSSEFQDFLARTGPELGLSRPVFDVRLYLSNFSRKNWPSMNAVLHYCETGAANRFKPHILVDPDYLAGADETADLSAPEAYVAVLENTKAPFLKPNAYFDPDIWIATEPAESTMSPVVSFLAAKAVGERRYSRYFSPRFYCRQDPQLRRDSPGAFLHYLARVAVEPLTECNPFFQNGWYALSYDIEHDDPLRHFILVGADQGFYPNPYAEDELRIAGVSAVSASIGDVLRDYIEVKAGKR